MLLLKAGTAPGGGDYWPCIVQHADNSEDQHAIGSLQG